MERVRRIRFARSILVLSLAAACGAAAPVRAEAATWKYRVTPRVKNNTLYYFTEIPNTERMRTQFDAEVNAVFRYGKNFKIVLEPVGAWDPTAKRPTHSAIAKGNKAVDNSELYHYDLREGYVQLRARPFTFTLGNQIFSWGVTDGFSPIDVVNSRRFVSPLSTEKLGAPALTVGLIQGDFDLELLYIPYQRKSVLPGEDSRWLPRSLYVTRSFENFQLRVPNNVRYYYVKNETLDDADQNNYGARLRGQLGGIDLGLMYFEGQASSPAVNVIIGGSVTRSPSTTQEGIFSLDPDVGLRPFYFKKRTFGGTLVYALGEFIFKVESAFTQQISGATNRALPGDYNENVASLEHDIPAGDGKLTVIAQATYSNYKTDTENGTTSLSRIFERAAALGIRYAPDEKLSFVTTALWDTLRKGGVFVMNGDYKIRDNLGASLTASIIDGSGLSPLGTYRKNDLLVGTLRYDF